MTIWTYILLAEVRQYKTKKNIFFAINILNYSYKPRSPCLSFYFNWILVKTQCKLVQLLIHVNIGFEFHDDALAKCQTVRQVTEFCHLETLLYKKQENFPEKNRFEDSRTL